MRFSISASSRSSWRRRSSCSACCGSPSSRLGSGGGSAATSRRICASNCCCSSCSWSICGGLRPAASPSSICVVGGSGDVARPFSASPPPASDAWAMACARVGAFAGARIHQHHLQRRVLEHALEALGVDHAHRQQRGMHAQRHQQRPVQGAQAAPGHGPAHVAGPQPVAGGDGSSAARPARPGRWPGAAPRRRGFRPRPRVRPARLRPRRGASMRASSAGVQLQRQQVAAGQAHAHPRAARQAFGAQRAEHQRQRVGAHQAVLHHRGVEFVDLVLLQPAQRPEALDRVLEVVVGRIGRVEAGDDGEQRRVLGLEGRRQRRGAAVARAGDDLPLVDQVDVAAQRRAGPGVLRHAHAGMRRRADAHAHLDARRQRRLAAVDAGHAALGQPAAPGAVGQDHRFGDDQVQRRAAHARADGHALVAHRLAVARLRA